MNDSASAAGTERTDFGSQRRQDLEVVDLEPDNGLSDLNSQVRFASTDLEEPSQPLQDIKQRTVRRRVSFDQTIAEAMQRIEEAEQRFVVADEATAHLGKPRNRFLRRTSATKNKGIQLFRRHRRSVATGR